MSLSMPISFECSSTLPCHTKPMAISNITTPSLSHKIYCDNVPLQSAVNPSLSVTYSPSASSHEKGSRIFNSPDYVLYSSYESELTGNKKKSKPQNTVSQFLHHKQGYEKKKLEQYRHDTTTFYYTTTPTIQNALNRDHEGTSFAISPPISVVCPLSLHERRQRNRASSARYRAKKNQQHGEMRLFISSLTKENDLLKRQLSRVKGENDRLKGNCDRLRGKLVAEKMLKKFLFQNNATIKVESASESSMILTLEKMRDDVKVEKRHG